MAAMAFIPPGTQASSIPDDDLVTFSSSGVSEAASCGPAGARLAEVFHLGSDLGGVGRFRVQRQVLRHMLPGAGIIALDFENHAQNILDPRNLASPVQADAGPRTGLRSIQILQVIARRRLVQVDFRIALLGICLN